MADYVNILSGELRGRVKKTIPWIQNAWVEFYDDLLGETQAKISSASNQEEAGYIGVVAMIADWNFGDEKGVKLDVSVENVRKLPIRVQKWLAETSTKIVNPEQEKEQKKDSPEP